MNDKVSPYYTYFTKANILAKDRKAASLRLAEENYLKALECKKTKEVYIGLSNLYLRFHDLSKYERTLLSGAEEGFAICNTLLGRFYFNKKTDYYDKEKAIEYYQKAIDAKEPQACLELAIFYYNENNEDVAYSLINKALEIDDKQWNGRAHFELAGLYKKNQKYEEAFKEFNKAAECGVGEAYYFIAMAYKEGLGVEKDIEKYSDNLFKHLNVRSALEIGGLYIGEQYIDSDQFLARTYFKYAASLGSPIGAIMYAAFLVSEPNYKEEEVFATLEIAFRNGLKDADLISKYQYIEDAFDSSVKEKIKELSEKYWAMKSCKA